MSHQYPSLSLSRSLSIYVVFTCIFSCPAQNSLDVTVQPKWHTNFVSSLSFLIVSHTHTRHTHAQNNERDESKLATCCPRRTELRQGQSLPVPRTTTTTKISSKSRVLVRRCQLKCVSMCIILQARFNMPASCSGTYCGRERAKANI